MFDESLFIFSLNLLILEMNLLYEYDYDLTLYANKVDNFNFKDNIFNLYL